MIWWENFCGSFYVNRIPQCTTNKNIRNCELNCCRWCSNVLLLHLGAIKKIDNNTLMPYDITGEKKFTQKHINTCSTDKHQRTRNTQSTYAQFALTVNLGKNTIRANNNSNCELHTQVLSIQMPKCEWKTEMIDNRNGSSLVIEIEISVSVYYNICIYLLSQGTLIATCACYTNRKNWMKLKKEKQQQQ